MLQHKDDEVLVVGRCAGCSDDEAVLREVKRDVWRCRRCIAKP